MKPWYLTLDEEGLRRIARTHFGACDDGDLHPDDLIWTLEPDFEIATLSGCIARNDKTPSPFPLIDRWIAWFRHECDAVAEELDGEREWDCLGEEEIDEPIVISIDGERVQIWDGWHRTGGSFAAGRITIPAIVGRPKT